ncbi:MAG: glycosyltransferase family 4 protein [Sedimentisphaerales bacterium]|nr:glycosyltransferase family 4 protein [Sedimentisphaerales bacterium]
MSENNSYKLNFVFHRFKHHSSHSGYDCLVRYADANHINSDLSPLASAALQKALKLALKNADVGAYNQHRLFGEIKVSLKLLGLNGNREIFHFLYGEDAYCYSGFVPRGKGKKIIATFHQPQPHFERSIRRRNHLKRLDKIVTVSRDRLTYFSEFVEKDKVCFIPHGIDTDFFVPVKEDKEQGSYACLFVGHWLRDFETLKDVIEIVTAKNKDIEFIIVTTQRDLKHLTNVSNADIRIGIPEDELLDHYQSSSLLVLPLVDCTANNSILEGLACGLPIVTTDVGGIRDYVDDNCAVLVPPKAPEIMAEKVLELIENKPLRKTMGENARKKALEFSWPLVAQKFEKLYLDLFSE